MILELQHYLHSILAKIPTVNSPKRLQKHPQLLPPRLHNVCSPYVRSEIHTYNAYMRYVYIYNVSYNYNVVGHAYPPVRAGKTPALRTASYAIVQCIQFV